MKHILFIISITLFSSSAFGKLSKEFSKFLNDSCYKYQDKVYCHQMFEDIDLNQVERMHVVDEVISMFLVASTEKRAISEVMSVQNIDYKINFCHQLLNTKEKLKLFSESDYIRCSSLLDLYTSSASQKVTGKLWLKRQGLTGNFSTKCLCSHTGRSSFFQNQIPAIEMKDGKVVSVGLANAKMTAASQGIYFAHQVEDENRVCTLYAENAYVPVVQMKAQDIYRDQVYSSSLQQISISPHINSRSSEAILESRKNTVPIFYTISYGAYNFVISPIEQRRCAGDSSYHCSSTYMINALEKLSSYEKQLLAHSYLLEMPPVSNPLFDFVSFGQPARAIASDKGLDVNINVDSMAHFVVGSTTLRHGEFRPDLIDLSKGVFIFREPISQGASDGVLGRGANLSPSRLGHFSSGTWANRVGEGLMDARDAVGDFIGDTVKELGGVAVDTSGRLMRASRGFVYNVAEEFHQAATGMSILEGTLRAGQSSASSERELYDECMASNTGSCAALNAYGQRGNWARRAEYEWGRACERGGAEACANYCAAGGSGDVCEEDPSSDPERDDSSNTDEGSDNTDEGSEEDDDDEDEEDNDNSNDETKPPVDSKEPDDEEDQESTTRPNPLDDTCDTEWCEQAREEQREDFERQMCGRYGDICGTFGGGTLSPEGQRTVGIMSDSCGGTATPGSCASNDQVSDLGLVIIDGAIGPMPEDLFLGN